MNKQLPRTFFLLIALAGCVLIGCSHVKENETESESNNSTELSSAHLTEESSSAEAKAFRVNDIFVSGTPLAEDRPFMLIDMNDIASTGHALEKTESAEHANGTFTYWEEEGITYVTHSSDTHPVSLILNKSGTALNCGLKIGMKETEIQLLSLPFEKFAKEDLFDESKSVAFAGSVIRDEKNPINTADFDSLYVYVGAMPEEEMAEYGIHTTSCVSIVALIKNETISHIILDMPTAG